MMNIYYITGHSDKTLDTLAHDLSKPPELVWLEPRPNLIDGQVGFSEAFQGLYRPPTNIQWFKEIVAQITFKRKIQSPISFKNWSEQCVPNNIQIEEARFYWQHSVLHLLAKDAEPGYRYFACGENKAFLKGLNLGQVSEKEIIFDEQKSIYLRQDLARFKLDTTGVNLNKLKMICYWDQNSLWAWRLMPI
jgi:hypothetical protein